MRLAVRTLTAALVASVAVAGCAYWQRSPANGAAVYVLEFCAEAPEDRAELAAAMAEATAPARITVRCGDE